MNAKKFSNALGNIGDGYVDEAVTYTAKKKSNVWLKWGAIAACLCLVIGVAIRIGIGFVPSQMTDIYREGNLIEITGESELPAKYDGDLLAFNLDFESYEFYYRFDGVPENTDDWYSLLASKYDTNGDIVLHCMFGPITEEDLKEDWKVDSVFTPEATQTKIINGVEVDIAQTKNSLKYKYWHYAIFTYDGVLYDVRVQSDNPEYVYEVLNQLISDNKSNAHTLKVTENSVGEIGRETFNLSVEISENDANTLSEIIHSGTWMEEPTVCESNCIINLKGHWTYYNSNSGILNQYDLSDMSIYSSVVQDVSGKSLVLSEEDRTTVNSILEKYITLSITNK